jgi:hypothetical protein
MSGLDQNIEVASRPSRLHCGSITKNDGSSRYSRFDQFIESRIRVIKARRGVQDPVTLVKALSDYPICSAIVDLLSHAMGNTDILW